MATKRAKLVQQPSTLCLSEKIIPRQGQEEVYWRDKAVRERLGFALEHDTVYKDVEFVVGKNQVRIPSHKLLLRLSSLVFENIISAHEQQGLNEIKLPNSSASMFKRLLKFIYTDELEMYDLSTFLRVAKDFGFKELPNQVIKILKKIKITRTNAVFMLDISKDLEDIELEQYSLTFIQSNAREVLESQEFVCVTYPGLCRLLQDDNLGADEITVFKAVLRWSQYQCKLNGLPVIGENIRDVLKAARMYIRYTLIPYDLLLSEIKESGILISSEFLQVLKTFIDPSSNPLGLVTKSRKTKKVIMEVDPMPFIMESLPAEVQIFPSKSTQMARPRRIRRKPNPSSSVPPLHVPLFEETHNINDTPHHSTFINQIYIPEFQFNVQNCSYSFHKLMDNVRTHELSHPIQEIILQDVIIYDARAHSLVSSANNRVHLPNLKRFHFFQHKDLSILLPDKTFMNGLTTKEFLFFEKDPKDPWTLSTLWGLGVDICIDVRGVKLMEINHTDHSLTLAFPLEFEANEIFEGLASSFNNYPLKSLCLTSCCIAKPEAIPTAELEVLVLQGVSVCSSESLYPSPMRIANKSPNLKRISLFGTQGCQLALGSDLMKCRSTLLSMALSKVKIGGWTKKNMKKSAIFTSLEELYLDVCSWSETFMGYFPISFPSIKRLAIRSSDQCRVSASFLKLILSIPSLERVAIFRYVCDDDTHENPNLDIFLPPVQVPSDKDDIHKLLMAAGMSFNNDWDVPDFILSRDINSPVGWSFIHDFYELDEAHFHCSLLNRFFADSEVSKSIGGG